MDNLLLQYIRTANMNQVAKCLDGSKSDQVNSIMKATGMAPIHVAVNKGMAEMTQLLISYNADVNLTMAKELGGFTALHVAARHNLKEIAEMLIECKADVNVKAEGSLSTPLHEAAQHGQDHIVQLLLSYQADGNVVDKHGLCPRTYAVNERHTAIANALPDVPYNTWKFCKAQPDYMERVVAIQTGGKKKKKAGKKGGKKKKK